MCRLMSLCDQHFRALHFELSFRLMSELRMGKSSSRGEAHHNESRHSCAHRALCVLCRGARPMRIVRARVGVFLRVQVSTCRCRCPSAVELLGESFVRSSLVRWLNHCHPFPSGNAWLVPWFGNCAFGERACGSYRIALHRIVSFIGCHGWARCDNLRRDGEGLFCGMSVHNLHARFRRRRVFRPCFSLLRAWCGERGWLGLSVFRNCDMVYTGAQADPLHFHKT